MSARPKSKEAILEDELEKRMEREKFDPKKCLAMKWISKVFKKNDIIIDRINIKMLAQFLDELIDLHMHREHYRKKKNVIYFLDKNLDKIRDFISKNKTMIKIKNESNEIKEFCIPPPGII